MIIDYFEAIFKEKLQKDSKIPKNLHKVPHIKLPWGLIIIEFCFIKLRFVVENIN